MTASEVVSGWPEATVERAAEAVRAFFVESLEGFDDQATEDLVVDGPEKEGVPVSESMEAVVVDDANAAHKLIGRSIGGVELVSFWAGSQTVFFCGPNGSAVGEFRKWGESVEVDAAPPATMRVLPDPAADTVLLDQVREIVAATKADIDYKAGHAWRTVNGSAGFDRIAALLAGGGE